MFSSSESADKCLSFYQKLKHFQAEFGKIWTFENFNWSQNALLFHQTVSGKSSGSFFIGEPNTNKKKNSLEASA